MESPETPAIELGVVIPCFNEAEVLPACHDRIAEVLSGLGLSYRVLYVDDGSGDDTYEVLRGLAARDRHVALLRLARNFGKEAALSAGLDLLDAQAVVVMDADLQDPPELLPSFWARFREGFDVVYGVRRSRKGESWIKRGTASLFYRVIGALSRTPVPRDVGDFRLLSRRAVLALRSLPERQRFMKGLFGWIGFRQIGIPYDRATRAAGRTSWNYWRLWNFAIEGITSFSVAPLKLATYVGLMTSTFAFGYGAWVIAKTLIFGEMVRGYPTLMVVILFLGGLQLLALGLIGEYLGRLYLESKQRPLYLVDEVVGMAAPAAPGSELGGRGRIEHRGVG
jgi:glycosyltransferase involved in cell wall biosynthesis